MSVVLPTKEQLQDLLRPKFGEGIDIICENPVFIGTQSMVSFGLLGILCVYQDEQGKKFAVQVPFGVLLQHERGEAA